MISIKQNTLVIRANSRFVFLKTDFILWIQAEGNYVRIYYQEKEYLVRETLKEICERIEDPRFVRINRSILVNASCICEMKFYKNSKVEVLLNNNKRWLWGGRTYHNNLDDMLKTLGIKKTS